MSHPRESEPLEHQCPNKCVSTLNSGATGAPHKASLAPGRACDLTCVSLSNNHRIRGGRSWWAPLPSTLFNLVDRKKQAIRDSGGLRQFRQATLLHRAAGAAQSKSTQSHRQTCRKVRHLRLPQVARDPFQCPPHANIMAHSVLNRLPGGHSYQDVMAPGARALKDNLHWTSGTHAQRGAQDVDRHWVLPSGPWLGGRSACNLLPAWANFSSRRSLTSGVSELWFAKLKSNDMRGSLRSLSSCQ